MLGEKPAPGLYIVQDLAVEDSAFEFLSEKIQIRIPNNTKDGFGQEIVGIKFAIGQNPASDYLNMIFEEIVMGSEIDIQIISMIGLMEFSNSLIWKYRGISLDISGLKKGAYIICIVFSNKEFIAKKNIKM